MAIFYDEHNHRPCFLGYLQTFAAVVATICPPQQPLRSESKARSGSMNQARHDPIRVDDAAFDGGRLVIIGP